MSDTFITSGGSGANVWGSEGIDIIQREIKDLKSKLSSLETSLAATVFPKQSKLYFNGETRVEATDTGVEFCNESYTVGVPIVDICGPEPTLKLTTSSVTRGQIGVLGDSIFYFYNPVGGKKIEFYISFSGGGSGAAMTLDENGCVLKNIPTASTGLPTGAIWNDSGALKIV
jgi:hypothetical protein